MSYQQSQIVLNTGAGIRHRSFNPLVAKLEAIVDLSEADRDALRELCSRTEKVAAQRDIVREGEKPGLVHVILEGWAARYKVVADGGRQITAFLVPGDYCDAHVAILKTMDHAILALTDVTVAAVPHSAIKKLPLDHPNLARALWWATLVDEAVLRAWIVNIGRRSAYDGTAHLICELHLRMRNAGLAEDGQFSMPLTQDVLADALGMTPVHINRTLQRLRKDGLITLDERVLTILDGPGLRRAAGFDDSYLHIRNH